MVGGMKMSFDVCIVHNVQNIESTFNLYRL